MAATSHGHADDHGSALRTALSGASEAGGSQRRERGPVAPGGGDSPAQLRAGGPIRAPTSAIGCEHAAEAGGPWALGLGPWALGLGPYARPDAPRRPGDTARERVHAAHRQARPGPARDGGALPRRLHPP